MDNLEKQLIWLNEKIIPLEEANINLMTTTAQYGINVFEGVRCYYNREQKQLYAFRLAEHLERLFNSAKILRFELNESFTSNYAEDSMKDVIKANDYKEDIYVKIGLYLSGKGSWSSSSPIGFFIYPFPKGRVYSDKIGLESCIVSWERIGESNIPPRMKAGANYLNSRLGQLEANRNGYDSAIFLNRNGHIAEGSGACLFMVRKGKLITPSVTGSILESITRQTIIDIAISEMNMSVDEREVDRTELYIADEIFFVGTSVEIIPIISVDKILINHGNVGHITNRLKELYFKIAKGTENKFKKWLTEIPL